MITCSTTPSLHNSQAIIFAQLSRSAFLTILEPGTGYIQSHTDFLYSLVCTVRYRNGLDARCILSASAIVLLGFIQLCGRFISHLSRGHNEVQNEKLETATKFSIKVNISALLSLKNVWLLFFVFKVHAHFGFSCILKNLARRQNKNNNNYKFALWSTVLN